MSPPWKEGRLTDRDILPLPRVEAVGHGIGEYSGVSRGTHQRHGKMAKFKDEVGETRNPRNALLNLIRVCNCGELLEGELAQLRER